MKKYLSFLIVFLAFGFVACEKERYKPTTDTQEGVIPAKEDSRNQEKVLDAESLIQLDPDYIQLQNILEDFTKKLAESDLSLDQIGKLVQEQEFSELAYSSGYSAEHLRVLQKQISTSAKSLALRYHINVNQVQANNHNSTPLENAVQAYREIAYSGEEQLENITEDIGGGTGVEPPQANCRYFPYTACLVVSASAASGCTVGAVACYALGAYLCYCSFCGDDVNHGRLC